MAIPMENHGVKTFFSLSMGNHSFFVLTPNNMGASVPLRKKQECKLGRRFMVASTIKPKNKVKNSVYGVFPFWVAQ